MKEQVRVILELFNGCFLGHLRILRAKTLMLGDTPNEDDDREPTAPIANDPYQAPALGESDGEEGLKDPTPKDTPEDETQEPDVAEVEEVQDDELLTRQQQREMRNAQANKKTGKDEGDKGKGGKGEGRGRGRGRGGRGTRKAPVVEDISEAKVESEGPAPSRPARARATKPKKAEVPAGGEEKGPEDVEEAKTKKRRKQTTPPATSHQPDAKAKAKAKAKSKTPPATKAAETGNTRKKASKRKNADEEEKCQPVPEDQRPDLKKPFSLI